MGIGFGSTPNTQFVCLCACVCVSLFPCFALYFTIFTGCKAIKNNSEVFFPPDYFVHIYNISIICLGGNCFLVKQFLRKGFLPLFSAFLEDGSYF